ncbi:unnamed protein product, partial [Amoebophrya sp. A120]
LDKSCKIDKFIYFFCAYNSSSWFRVFVTRSANNLFEPLSFLLSATFIRMASRNRNWMALGRLPTFLGFCCFIFLNVPPCARSLEVEHSTRRHSENNLEHDKDKRQQQASTAVEEHEGEQMKNQTREKELVQTTTSAAWPRWQRMKDQFWNATSRMKNFFGNAFARAKDRVTGAVTDTKKSVGSAVSTATDTVTSATHAATQAAQSATHAVSDAINK